MEPVCMYLLELVKGGSLDNGLTAWYTTNHSSSDIDTQCAPEVSQMETGETNENSDSKQGSILSFLTSECSFPESEDLQCSIIAMHDRIQNVC